VSLEKWERKPWFTDHDGKEGEKVQVRLGWWNKLDNTRGVYVLPEPEEFTNRGQWKPELEGAAFQWGEGNYSCDDNRAIFFLGLPPSHTDPDYACNTENLEIEYVEIRRLENE
jgi:hypothetical protein